MTGRRVRRSSRTPKLRFHKSSGQGYVEIDGKRRYLGKYELAKTRQAYHRILAEWEAGGRSLPREQPTELTVHNLVWRFWRFAQRYYRKPDGSQTSEVKNYTQALRPLRVLYGSTKANDFGPRALKVVRTKMIAQDWCRSHINQSIGRIKRLFKWGVENELVRPEVYQAIAVVAGLRRGRTDARESEPVKPVPEAVIAATLPHLTPTIRAMVTLQQLSGMRPGEVCSMRGCNLDTTGQVWIYRPDSHKTQYHGRSRAIYLGPRAQEVIQPFLRGNVREHLFSPTRSEKERRAARHKARNTPKSYGNVPGSNRVEKPQTKPGTHYTPGAYWHAIGYACRQAWPAPEGLSHTQKKQWNKEHRWGPNRLRHSYATAIRKKYGLEAAQVLLGHARADVSQIYAERDATKAIEVAAKIG